MVKINANTEVRDGVEGVNVTIQVDGKKLDCMAEAIDGISTFIKRTIPDKKEQFIFFTTLIETVNRD